MRKGTGKDTQGMQSIQMRDLTDSTLTALFQLQMMRRIMTAVKIALKNEKNSHKETVITVH